MFLILFFTQQQKNNLTNSYKLYKNILKDKTHRYEHVVARIT
jgi:hypothetical protein